MGDNVTFYLCILHGESITLNNTYISIVSPIPVINLYGEHLDELYSTFLSKFIAAQTIIEVEEQKVSDTKINNLLAWHPQRVVDAKKTFCEWFTKGCPFFRLNIGTINLPPMTFSVNKKVDPIESIYSDIKDNYGTTIWSKTIHKKNAMGIWKYTFNTNKNNLCNITNIEQLKNWEHFTSKERWSWADIFSIIKNDIQINKLDNKKTILGMYNCRNVDSKYMNDPVDVTNIMPHIDRTNIKTALVNPINSNQNMSLLTLDATVVEKATGWSALAKLYGQGCGFNVLAIYNIVNTRDAREQATCLNLTGLSIWKIVDYMHDYFTKILYAPQDQTYRVLRSTLANCVAFIFHYFRMYPIICENSTQCAIGTVLKIYNQNKINADKYSDVGHTISLMRQSDQNIYMVDPQVFSGTEYKKFMGKSSDLTKNHGQLGADFILSQYDYAPGQPRQEYADIIFPVRNGGFLPRHHDYSRPQWSEKIKSVAPAPAPAPVDQYTTDDEDDEDDEDDIRKHGQFGNNSYDNFTEFFKYLPSPTINGVITNEFPQGFEWRTRPENIKFGGQKTKFNKNNNKVYKSRKKLKNNKNKTKKRHGGNEIFELLNRADKPILNI